MFIFQTLLSKILVSDNCRYIIFSLSLGLYSCFKKERIQINSLRPSTLTRIFQYIVHTLRAELSLH